MDTNKIWGFILIGVCVLFALWGLASLYAAFSYSDQMSALTQQMGAFGGKQMAAALAANKPSYFTGIFLLAISGASGYFGNSMLKNLNEAKQES